MNKIKFLLYFALLVSGVEGRAQIYIDSYKFGEAAGTLLLDSFGNSSGAYSLRKLRAGYTGNCVEVRRASDNTTSNIGFVDNFLDTATLKTFCSGTNCFVKTWYDQSTNTRNAEQTTNASQPQIVSSGALIRQNNNVTVQFASHFLSLPNAMMTPAHGLFIAYKDNGTNQGALIGQWASGQANRLLFSVNQNCGGSGAADSLDFFINGTLNGSCSNSMGDITISAMQFTLISSVAATGTDNWKTYRNNVFNDDATIPSAIYSAVNTSIGSVSAGVNSQTLNGFISEIIFYQENKDADRSAINANINTFYSIY